LAACCCRSRHNLDLASRIGNLADQTTRTLDNVRRIGSDLEREIKQTFRQLEALQNLSAMLPATDVLPATRGWAASPDLLAVLVGLVITERPSLVVECGSGASALWLALAMRRFEIHGRIIALDHDPVFGGKTRCFLARHDVSDLAEVRDAPLESFSLDGETYSWYARQAWGDLTGIDLLFVDGPPAATGHRARYPALPLLSGSLSPVAPSSWTTSSCRTCRKCCGSGMMRTRSSAPRSSRWRSRPRCCARVSQAALCWPRGWARRCEAGARAVRGRTRAAGVVAGSLERRCGFVAYLNGHLE
jgi:predicted O-methyltransferase YrrM